MKFITLKMEKLKKLNNKLKILTDANSYNYCFIVLFAIAFLNSFNIEGNMAFDKGFSLFISTRFFIFMLMLIFFYSTNRMVIYFENNYSFSIRLKDKRKYLREIIKYSTFSNFILYLTFIFVSLVILIFKTNIVFIPTYIDSYGISILFYSLIKLIKYFVIINFLSIFGIIIFKTFSKTFSYIYYILLCVLYYNFALNLDIINSFGFKDVLYLTYLNNYQYINLTTEITNFIIVCCIYYIFYELFLLLTIKYNKIKVSN